MSQVGFGTKLEYKQGAGAWTELVDILTINPPTPKIKMAEYQALRINRWKRRKAGVGDVGEFKFTMVHIAATLLTLVGFLFDETIQWRITRSDGTSTEVFAGLIAELPRKVVADEIDHIECAVMVDGAIAFS